MTKIFDNHTHTEYSNLRLLDSINKAPKLIDAAIDLGLSGIAITDHECISVHMEVNMYAKELQETNPDFTIALGNEIYLCDSIDSHKYYHFILIAKDKIGHKQLSTLSSQAWFNSYSYRGMTRVPTIKSDLEKVVSANPGHLIATTACLAGELASSLKEDDAKQTRDFLLWCKDLFDDDFYIEVAPSASPDQCNFHKNVFQISDDFGIKVCIGSDAHYIGEEDRKAHKAYLNSKEGEREVDAFYSYSHLQDKVEMIGNLSEVFTKEQIHSIFETSQEIKDKITFYDLTKSQEIPEVKLKETYVASTLDLSAYPTLKKLKDSSNNQERFWLNECLKALEDKKLVSKEYLERIEIEADIIDFVGEKLNECLFAYFNTFQHYIELFWECGSIIGPGRGSATGFLSNYLLGITQMDPVEWNIPYWRFLNKERVELPDIDIDLAPSKRPLIIQKIKEERGEFGIVQVATFGTEGTKSAILAACRGYRSANFPKGVPTDVAQYISSLVVSDRGFLWSLDEMAYGSKEKKRTPNKTFLKEVNQFPGLLDIMLSIEGVVNKRGIHASGVIMYGDDPLENSSFMKAVNGEMITAYDLHMAEAAGDTKYDFLVTEISDKIIQSIELLQKEGYMEQGSLKETYNKYLHPAVLDTKDSKIWEALADGTVIDCFQFSTGVGLQIAKKLKPKNPIEMTAANALMRLRAESGEEPPQDRYLRMKNNYPTLLLQEMGNKYKLSIDEIQSFRRYVDDYYGCVPLQEQMMQILMDKDLTNFTLTEANDARKIVAKKQMDRIPELKTKVFTSVENKNLAQYIWDIAVSPSLGYAFSFNHSLPYSFVGIQSIYLATNYPQIFWNTACLRVNSGITDGATNYGKNAKAICDSRQAGINISLLDINKSRFHFEPHEQTNTILYGFKGVLNINEDAVTQIIENRPYETFEEFMSKCPLNKKQMVSLIKAGAFDQFDKRELIMGQYLWITGKMKKRITMQNVGGLIAHSLLPEELDFERRVFNFNKFLKKNKVKNNYVIKDDYAKSFLCDNFTLNVEFNQENELLLDPSVWDTYGYQPYMDNIRTWMNTKDNKDFLLSSLNEALFWELWEKYASKSISAWELETCGFYYHEHELRHADFERYGISQFSNMDEEPVPVRYSSKGIKKFPIYNIETIIGTCIDKDKVRNTFTILGSDDSVITMRIRKEMFSIYDKQISQKQPDGTSKIVEKSWFNRGKMLLIRGYRRGEEFVPKKYASTGGHTLYQIDSIDAKGELILRGERADV